MLMTKRQPEPVGDILVEEFLQPLGISHAHLAHALGLSLNQAQDLCESRLAITQETALGLANLLGTSAAFWINTQTRVDLWRAA